jgi:hypothetical protein
MLEPEEKTRIRAEEEERVRQQKAREEEAARVKALETYRANVQSELRGSRRLPIWIPVFGALLVGGATAVYSVIPRATPVPEDTSGGIATSSLVLRCQDEVRSRLGDGRARFPTTEETTAQISSSSDGKRWDGWVICPTPTGEARADFSCTYTPATDSLTVEIIKP